MNDWISFCGETSRPDVTRACLALDTSARLEFATSADGLRRAVFESAPGELGVIVGPAPDGVSDVNLAAALAHDGNARRVVLATAGVSGSLRSRAARAGVDLVVDFEELGEGPCAEAGRSAADGGPCTLPAAVPLPTSSSRPEGTAPEGSAAPVLVFCSGRGGVGKTSIVAAAAAQATLWGLRVVALDLDLSCGNLYSCFGLTGGFDLARHGVPGEGGTDATRGVCVGGAPSLRVLGPCERPETAELAMPHVGGLLERLSHECDLVLVDTSTTFTDAVAQAAQRSDRLVLVTDTRPGAAAALARMAGLAVRLGVARTRIARLENRTSPRSRMDFALGRAEVGLEAARAFRTFEGGAEVSDLLSSGDALDLAEAGSAFSDSVACVLAQLLAELGRLPPAEGAQQALEADAPGRHRGLLGRLREAR